jgi:hypothetical protein
MKCPKVNAIENAFITIPNSKLLNILIAIKSENTKRKTDTIRPTIKVNLILKLIAFLIFKYFFFEVIWNILS